MAVAASSNTSDIIFTYRPGCPVYSVAWSARPDHPLRFAVSTFVEAFQNKVQIVQQTVSPASFVKRAEIDHPYPPTKVSWIPDKAGKLPDLLATAGDSLRLWELAGGSEVTLRGTLVNQFRKNHVWALARSQRGSASRTSEFSAPITSMDWNESDPSIIGTASIDTTCTIWNVETQQAKTQLIAHDREVFDIAFARGVDVFATVGSDGSLRTFDLRNLEHSTILYEVPDGSPLVRVAWNKQDPNLVATFAMDSNRLVVLDIRVPAQPLHELVGHTAAINSFTWAPHMKYGICTASKDLTCGRDVDQTVIGAVAFRDYPHAARAWHVVGFLWTAELGALRRCRFLELSGDDALSLVWDISATGKPVEDPYLVYKGDGPINQIAWSTLQPDWVLIGSEGGTKVTFLYRGQLRVCINGANVEGTRGVTLDEGWLQRGSGRVVHVQTVVRIRW